jgi:hypothetical protein
MKDRNKALIDILFDDSATVSERDDAAMQLVEFSDICTLNALIAKGKDLNEDEIVLNSIGESLGAIWVKENKFNEKIYRMLAGTTRYGVYVVIKSRKPEWIEQYELEKDNFAD